MYYEMNRIATELLKIAIPLAVLLWILVTREVTRALKESEKDFWTSCPRSPSPPKRTPSPPKKTLSLLKRTQSPKKKDSESEKSEKKALKTL